MRAALIDTRDSPGAHRRRTAGAGGLSTAVRGRLYAGTSGFAYPGWAPRFYPAGLRADELLPFYGRELPACELNNTYYQQPTEAKVHAWLAATPETFRFAVKAQRGGSMRSLAVDPIASVEWLTTPLRPFGDRLGSVLYRVPGNVRADIARLDGLLAAWPRDLPLTMEFQDASWHIDEVFHLLREAGAALCATDLPDVPEPPVLRHTGRFLYLRLRRHDYDAAEIAAWAARLEPFLAAGNDAFAFFRHDDTGRGPELARELIAAVGATDPALGAASGDAGIRSRANPPAARRTRR
ncbi:MAG: DUF72 domain-containing protein [Chloroflexota bacterium]